MPSSLEQAFRDQPQLLDQIKSHISRTKSSALFDQIAEYINTLTRHDSTISEERSNKKRKLDEDQRPTHNGTSGSQGPVRNGDWDKADAYYSVKEVSFSVPQRKKLTLELSPESSYTYSISTTGSGGPKQTDPEGKGGIRAINPTSGEVEFGMSWREVEQIICLPVPEKQQRTHNFLVVPIGNDGVSHAILPPAEQIVFSLPETFPKTATSIAAHVPPGSGDLTPPDPDSETYITSTIRYMNASLAHHHKSVILPDEAEFASAIPQPHRKGEKAFHVKAFRGSKEGYLYFLPIGIVFGFKKPLLLIQFQRVDSISYTSVLQRTFNIVVATSDQSPGREAGEDPEAGQKRDEFEFSMVDQADFAGIDAWVKKHGLNDLSMAEQRRAKLTNLFAGPRGDGVNIKAGGEEIKPGSMADQKRKADRYEPGELERAARQVEQDEEDEEEEDYDPGSEGESEGEGGSSEEDGEGDGEGEFEEEIEEEGEEEEEE